MYWPTLDTALVHMFLSRVIFFSVPGLPCRWLLVWTLARPRVFGVGCVCVRSKLTDSRSQMRRDMAHVQSHPTEQLKQYVTCAVHAYIYFTSEKVRPTGFYSRVVCVKNLNERGRSEWGFLTQTTSECNPVQSTFYFVTRLLHVRREFSLK